MIASAFLLVFSSLFVAVSTGPGVESTSESSSLHSCNLSGLNKTVSCDLGYYCTNGTCQCRKAPSGIVYCSENKFYVLGCYCATSSGDYSTVNVGTCISECGSSADDSKYMSYYQPRSDSCAYLNRTGTLCGSCLPNQYSLAYSFDIRCISCSHASLNWVKYIMAAYPPLTLFYLFILLIL